MTSRFISYLSTIMLALIALPGIAGNSYTNEPAKVVWPMNTSEYEVYETSPEGVFSTIALNKGDLEVTGTGTGQPVDENGKAVIMTKFKPSGSTKDVEWSVKPAKGLVFTPTRVSAYITRFGTDAENGVKVIARNAAGVSVDLGTFTASRNNKSQAEDKYGKNSNYATRFDITLTAEQQEQLKSADGFSLFASVGVGSSKEGGFGLATIEGVVNGTAEDVAKYTLEATASPAEGGVVSVYPKSEQYDAGSIIKLTAEKNFGYRFINWTDAEGKEVSAESSFEYQLNADSKLTANFEAVATYALETGVDGGANSYMVIATPSPVVVDGKNMYEAGTKVTLKAISNRVLTFTNWNDGQSSSEISFEMDADKEFIASYSAIDYVVGWDFWRAGGDGRPADFAAADNDAVTLVLRNAAGETSGWLDKSELAAGGYEGRPGAVNWRTTGLGEYYWQTTVNASAFTNLKVVTAMLYNYNAYTVYNVEFSTDGETWTKAGSIKIDGRKAWADAEIQLPASVNNCKSLSIRWIADKSSAVDGTTSDNDGIALGASFILGDMELVNDGTAPVLVANVPEDGSNTASINGKIVLTYDEKVKVKEGVKATLNDMQLTPSVTGRTVIFEYKNLAYATDYRFNLEANSVADLTDNYNDKAVTINFTTKTRPVVAKGMYDFIVPDNGKLEEAFAAAAAREDKTKRFRIFIKNGFYKLPASETAVKVGNDNKNYPDPTTYMTAPNLSIIGESMDGVVITNTVPDAKGVLEGIGKGDVMRLEKTATNYYFQNLTMKSAMGDGAGRDIVLNDNADKTIMKDACLWAYQDTYVSNNASARYYFEGGVLRGRTDFLCGKGDVFYNGVTLRMIKGGYIVAPSQALQYGYVFRDCEIIEDAAGTDGNFTLGRPWGQGTPTCYYINTRMVARPSAIGWNEMSGGYPVRFAEYNSTTASGTVIDLAARKKVFADVHANNPVLTKEEADAINYSAVMGRDDDWDPASLAEQAPAPADVIINGTALTWQPSEYAMLWAIVKNGKVVDFTTEPSYTVDDPNATYAVRAANEMGGLGEEVLAKAGSESGVTDINAANSVVNTIYYNAEGIRVSADYRGVVIKVDTLASGETVTTKIINK